MFNLSCTNIDGFKLSLFQILQNILVAYSTMKTTPLFLSVFLSVSLFGQNVYIPDANFKACLVGNSSINTNGDTEIQVSEATSFNGYLQCGYQNISDLTGVEAFINLSALDVGNNLLQSLDLSQNNALQDLSCDNNFLSSLDVNQNHALSMLKCDDNQLTVLNLNGAALEYLYCDDNLLTTLDLSQNNFLRTLECDDNFLLSLDVSQNNALSSLKCDDNQLTDLSLNGAALEYLYCDENLLTTIDLSENVFLRTLECDNNFLSILDVSQNNALSSLKCDDNQLTDLSLNGAALEYLYCYDNLLTNLDLSQNIFLRTLECDNNFLSSLDISLNNALSSLKCDDNQLTMLNLNGDALEYLYCYDNLLTTLDLSQNPSLGHLDCHNNQLSCLNVANGGNIGMYDFYVDSNPNLTCIEVDDEEWSTMNWLDTYNYISIDSQTSFSEDCHNACSSSSSLNELTTSKKLIQIIDILGRETSYKANKTLIYVYDNGSTEKVFIIE